MPFESPHWKYYMLWVDGKYPIVIDIKTMPLITMQLVSVGTILTVADLM